jgi:hypothetical protein
MKINETSFDTEMFEDIMGITVHTGCEHLDKKLNSHICYKGGGGTQTTTTGFATEFKPEIQDMLNQAKDLYNSGQLGQIADLSKSTQAGLEAGTQAAQQQQALASSMADIAGQPVDLSGMRTAAQLDAMKALGTTRDVAGARGGLGGSRQALNQANLENELAAKFAGIDQQAQAQQMQNLGQALGAQTAGYKTLSDVGATEQQYLQAKADQPYTALAQRVGLFSGVAPKETTTTGGGGK